MYFVRYKHCTMTNVYPSFQNQGSNLFMHPTILVSDLENIHVIPAHQIILLEAQGSYTRIVTINKEILASRPLKEYDKQLEKMVPFYRSHHSYLVNLNFLERYDKINRELILDHGYKASVSIRKKDGLMSLLFDRL